MSMKDIADSIMYMLKEEVIDQKEAHDLYIAALHGWVWGQGQHEEYEEEESN